LLLLCLGLLGCSTAGHHTRIKVEGGEIRYQRDDRPEWLTEAELAKEVSPEEMAALKKALASLEDQLGSEKRRKMEEWLRQTPAQAATEMRRTLPAGFTIEIDGHYVIASDGDAGQQKEIKLTLLEIERRCRRLVGEGRPSSVGPIRVYYAKNAEKYEEAYKAEFGQPPAGYLGICDPEPPARLFGSASTGNGSVAHELTHVLLMNDSPQMPGWLNESLAVAVGCPVQSFRSDKGSLDDVYLYAAVRAIREHRWTPLDRTLEIRGAGYQDLDKEKLDVPMLSLELLVGPLTTGCLFVRWMNETGALPAFYRGFRDTEDAGKAVEAAFPGVARADVEKRLLAWIASHEEESLIHGAVKQKN
jgi:hypothetical protein